MRKGLRFPAVRATAKLQQIFLTLTAIAGLSVPQLARAQQDYPARPVHTVIGFAAGGGADILIRYINKQLETVSGKTFVVDNKPGGGGLLAASLVAKAKPDGYTLLHAANTVTVGAKYFQKDVTFDAQRDFVPIASFVEGTYFIGVSAESPIKTMPELLAFLRSRPQNRFGFGSNLQLLAGQYFSSAAKINATPVAYKSIPDAIPDVVAGSLEFIVIDYTFGMSAIRSGKLRAIAATSATRYPGIDTPLLKEVGFPDADFAAWWGLFAPKGTPDAAIAKLADWMKQVTTSAETKEYFAKLSNLALTDDGPATAKRIEREIALWGPAVKAAGIVPQ